jgi:hypothetical protein
MLRHFTIREHVKRVEQVVQEIYSQLPSASPESVTAWFKTFQRLKELGYTNEGDTPGLLVEDFIDGLNEPNQLSSDGVANILAWTQTAPASELKTTFDSLTQGETTIQNLLNYIEDYIEGSPSGGDGLEILHEIGSRLTSACVLVLTTLEQKTDE